MNHKGVKIAALVLAGVMAFTNSPVSSATGVANIFPAAGFALAVGEGVAIGELITGQSQSDTASINVSTQVEKTTAAKETETVSLVSNLTPETTVQEDTAETAEAPVISTAVKETASGNDVVSEETAAENKTENTEPADNTTDNSAATDDGNTDDETDNAEAEDTQTVSSNDTEESVSANDVEAEEETESVSANEIEQDFSGLVIAQVNDYVNVRAGAGEDNEIVGKLYNKSVGTFIEEEDGWYKIKSGNVEGYVKGEYCVTGKEAEALVDEVGEKIATVTTTTLKVRKEPGMDAEVLGLIPIEEELPVLEETDGWVKISIEEGEGYVSSEYVSLRVDFVEAESKEEEEARLAKEEKERQAARAAANARMEASTTNVSKKEAPVVYASSEGSAAGQAVANYGLQFVGNPYVYGGTSLTNGADCSGFVMSVYANFGVSLPHSSSADRRVGYEVEGGLANAQPGDLICYSGHVALYIGNGQIVHASTSKTGIIVSNASYRQPLAVRRIF